MTERTFYTNPHMLLPDHRGILGSVKASNNTGKDNQDDHHDDQGDEGHD